ncbi:MAG TPA: acylphosphatase [Bacillota bacterium]
MSESQPLVGAHVLVSGRVQGVGFRAATRTTARRLGLGGWVRNLPDGRVEGWFVGPRSAVEAMVAWCHHGPNRARVDRVEVQWREAAGRPGEFRVRP